MLTEAKVTEITEDAISYEKDGEVHTIADADTLVLAMGYRPNTKLADDLAAAGVATHVLGDANKCGNIRDAIGDGYKVLGKPPLQGLPPSQPPPESLLLL